MDINRSLTALVGQTVMFSVRLGSIDIRLTGRLSTTDWGFYLEVVEGKTYALFNEKDVHYVDMETRYIGIKFAKGFIEYLPVEDNEWSEEIFAE